MFFLLLQHPCNFFVALPFYVPGQYHVKDESNTVEQKTWGSKVGIVDAHYLLPLLFVATIAVAQLILGLVLLLNHC